MASPTLQPILDLFMHLLFTPYFYFCFPPTCISTCFLSFFLPFKKIVIVSCVCVFFVLFLFCKINYASFLLTIFNFIFHFETWCNVIFSFFIFSPYVCIFFPLIISAMSTTNETSKKKLCSEGTTWKNVFKFLRRSCLHLLLYPMNSLTSFWFWCCYTFYYTIIDY